MEGDSFLIDLLRPELLHEVLCYLDATSLGTAAKVSKLMMPLTDEAQRRPHLVAKLGRLGAVAEELMSTLPASPSMGILFSDTSHSGDMKSRFTEAIKVLPPFTDVVGAVSPQLQVQVGGKLECASDGSTCSASLMLGRFPEAHFKTFVLTEDIMKQQPTAEVLLELAGLVEVSSGSIGKEQTDWKVFCVLVAGEGGRYAEKALSAIQGKYPKAAIVGGIAQGAFARAAGLDLQYYEDCIVGLAMAGNVPLHALVTRGARPLGPVHTVTDCEPVVGHAGSEYLLLKRCRPGDNQSENDGKLDSRNDSSVLSVFEDSYRSMDQSGMGMIYAGVKLKRRAGLVSPTGDCDTEPEGFMLQSISNGNIQGGEMVIMDPLIEAARGGGGGGSGGGSEGDESTSLEQRKARRLAAWRSAENPYEGLQLQFYQLDEKTCKSDAETQLTRAKEQLDAQGRELMGALMFSCGGRGPHEFAGHVGSITYFPPAHYCRFRISRLLLLLLLLLLSPPSFPSAY